MAQIKSKVIGLIEIEPNSEIPIVPETTSSTARQTTRIQETQTSGDTELRRRSSVSTLPTAALEADLHALMAQLNDELYALHRRLDHAIAVAHG